MKIVIPGVSTLNLKHVFIDYNGTIAHSGKLISGVMDQLTALSEIYNIYVLTGDTYGTVSEYLKPYPVEVILAYTAEDKCRVIKDHTPSTCITIGNGSIDYKMLKEAALGIAVIGREGCSTKAIMNADIVVHNIEDALTIIKHPNQIIATLKE